MRPEVEEGRWLVENGASSSLISLLGAWKPPSRGEACLVTHCSAQKISPLKATASIPHGFMKRSRKQESQCQIDPTGAV